MKLVRNVAALAVTAAALIIPATVSAHPSVYTDTARIDTNPAPVLFTLTDQVRHVVTNHGYTMVLRESNGATTNGVMDYSRLPGDYRASLTGTQVLAEGDTAAQAHATCRGVAALETEEAIRAWQGPDPFYNYVPFQKTAAGLQDEAEVEAWIEDVKARTTGLPGGPVDLATVADPAAACVGLGGTYTLADATQTTTASLNSGYAHDLTTPLDAKIAQLESEKAALEAQVAQLKMEATKLQIDKASASSTVAAANAGTSLKLTGPAGKSVLVRLLASNRNQARQLGLKSRVLGSATATFGADGTALIKITPSGKPADALKKLKGSVKVLFQAVSGDRLVAIRSTLKK